MRRQGLARCAPHGVAVDGMWVCVGVVCVVVVGPHTMAMHPCSCPCPCPCSIYMPYIASVARRVLAQPVCASAAERNWSVYGQIKTASRSRMSHAVGDKLVYAHEALHMKVKLQHASYTQHVEKWDSDSDSDG